MTQVDYASDVGHIPSAAPPATATCCQREQLPQMQIDLYTSCPLRLLLLPNARICDHSGGDKPRPSTKLDGAPTARSLEAEGMMNITSPLYTASPLLEACRLLILAPCVQMGQQASEDESFDWSSDESSEDRLMQPRQGRRILPCQLQTPPSSGPQPPHLQASGRTCMPSSCPQTG